MTDNQFAILITVIGGGLAAIGAAIRFSVNRLTRALDENSKMMLGNATAMASMATKLDGVVDYIYRLSGLTPPAGVPIPRKNRAPSAPIAQPYDPEGNQEP